MSTITLKNDLAEMGRLGARVASFGREHELPAGLIEEIRLALEEVVTNIISYGYGYEDQGRHTIEVSIVDSEQDIIISVRDDGRPFNLLEHPVPDLDLPLEYREVGGLGIHIMRKLMDQVDYMREDGSNLVVMSRHK
ncbi:MAG: ATP-binding protein [Desulfobacterales bacterium]|nr:ATP-binding protein [Desulfobacterales bacterium]